MNSNSYGELFKTLCIVILSSHSLIMDSIDPTSKPNDYGKWLSQPPSGEEILITGIAGAYPESRNLFEFRDNLYNKIDMVTIDDRRWSITHPEIPERAGKLPDVEKFDAGFFGIHRRQAEAMDPMVRILLQKTIEAVMDAGLNPKELENTNTGVFIGSSFSESEPHWFYKQFQKQQFALTGCTRSMISHRISYFLKLKGPSFNIDTACSSSLFALEQAYKAIRNGTCDRAIVGGINLCLHPYVTLQFSRLGVLSREGKCKVFDRDSDGYVRSEAATVIILQKSNEAKRNYCRMIHSKTNCDGFKQQGITFPSRDVQKQLLSDVYTESGVKPEELSYLEAHGTATYVGDPEEVASIDLIFCKNRSKELLVGSVKSNVGHSEPSSGLTSIAKAIISMENGVIPPNLHYYKPREGVEPLESGRLHIVTENTKFQDDRGLIGVSSFGFGGANSHTILHWNDKIESSDTDDHCRLVCVSGRTPQTVDKMLNNLKNRKYNRELIRLYHDIFKINIPGNYFRGFTILSKQGELQRIESSHFNPRSPKLCLIIGEFSTCSITDLSKIPICQELFQKCEHILSSQQFAVLNSDKSHTDQIMSGVLTQLALIEIVKATKLTPDLYLGCGYGELICAYLDGCLTLEQTLISSLLFAKNEQNDINIFTKMIENERLSKREKLFNGKEADEKLLQTLDGVMELSKKPNKWAINGSENLPRYLLKTVQNSQNKTSHSEIINKLERDTTIVTLGDISIDFGKHLSVLQLENRTKNIFQDLFSMLGRLYLSGFDLQLDELYPKVSFPVSRGTPMISPLIEWNQNDYFVTYYRPLETCVKSGEAVFEINLSDEKWSFLSGHVIDGRNLFPATGYLMIVWQAFAFSLGTITANLEVVFENCYFHRATNLTKDKNLELTVMVCKGSGQFEVTESKTVVVSGRIYVPKSKGNDQILFPDTNAEYSMDTKDVYKELRLRGYNYSGGFKNIIACNEEITEGLIHWEDNWTTFTDNMLQLKVLQIDTRTLYVPVYIKRLSIDAKRHIALVRSMEDEHVNLPVKLNQNMDSMRCGGIELQGLKAASISRKKLNLEPVLERYVFVPNETEITLTESLRITLQIILENNLSLNKITIGEISSDDNLGTKFEETLLDFPIITSNGANLIENSQEANYSDFDLVIGKHILQKPDLLAKILKEIKGNSFVLSREFILRDCPDINILTVHETPKETLVLFQKKFAETDLAAVDISDCTEFTWLKDVQNLMKNQKNVILYSQNQPTNGILGLINCMRKEPGLGNVRCALIQSQAPDFDPDLEFYRKQLSKNMAINIYQDGTWGTYRHLSIEYFPKVPSQHCYVNNLIKGDLSSIDWVEGPLSEYNSPSKELVYVYYSSLNFRDVMIASGKINADVITMNRTKQECIQGFEFVGRNSNGKRVMGMAEAGAMATMLEADRDFLWHIPDEWSMEDAATVPIVYATLIYAFFMRSELKAGNSILIHSGTGGVGLAAINLALHHGCSVFTTVGSLEKKEFLRRMFPQIPETHIGNSRNTTFEQMIYHQTKGRGVDFVLNSLSEDKLQASVRCLAPYGTFIEIGKFDLAKDSPLHLTFLEKQASFLGVMLDLFFSVSSEFKKQLALKLLTKIREGAVKPLPRTVFSEDEVENAFRYMTTGKHIGKVLVKIRDEESERVIPPQIKMMHGRARYIANPKYSYVIIGGLGGFGLELADWLVLRGARKLVLNSRKGLKNGYQNSRIRTWRKYGVIVRISTDNTATKHGCFKLLNNANKLGSVAAIFNLAVDLKDSLFENQCCDTFKASFTPKALATQYLDDISREICPELRTFVVFSSVSCGRGNAGQSNYGMSNSVMERICEKRHREGLPALAVQWGAVGDVGIVAEMQQDEEKQIGGTLPQPILNCLNVLESFLRQTDSVIVSSILLGQKRSALLGDDLVQVVAQILGIKDMKTISLHAPLSELGMDSMTAQEIQQTLEREFQVFLGLQDIRNITFAEIQNLQNDLKGDHQAPPLINNLIRHLVNSEEIAFKYVQLKTKLQKDSTDVIMFPGIEGTAQCFTQLASELKMTAVSLQYSYDEDNSTVDKVAQSVISTIERRFISNSKKFFFIAYSYGVVIALQAIQILEQKGFVGTLICIDGAPELFTDMLRNTEDVETQIVCHVLTLCMSPEIVAKNRADIKKAINLQEKLNLGEDLIREHSSYSSKHFRKLAEIGCQRICSLENLSSIRKIKSKIILYKPTNGISSLKSEDYDLSKLCEGPVNVKVYDGNHVTILNSLLLAEDVNNIYGK